MPRTEKSLDPLAGPLAAFAYDLRILREKAGHVPYRALARRAGFSASTLSVAASGTVLPSLDVTLAYVQACGADPEPWRERWQSLVAEQASADAAPAPTHAREEEPDELLPAAAGGVLQVLDVTPPAPTVYAAERARRGMRSAYAVVAAVVATLVAFALATVSSGSRAAPTVIGLANTAGQLQLGELYGIICQGVALHADADASAGLQNRGDMTREWQFLLTAANGRISQADQLAQLNVSQIPDGTQIVQSLHDSWADRTMADMYYAMYEENSGEMASSSDMINILGQAQSYDNAAQLAEDEAVSIWNSHAPALGVPRISERML
jgi:helix-turn-helix protein